MNQQEWKITCVGIHAATSLRWYEIQQCLAQDTQTGKQPGTLKLWKMLIDRQPSSHQQLSALSSLHSLQKAAQKSHMTTLKYPSNMLHPCWICSSVGGCGNVGFCKLVSFTPWQIFYFSSNFIVFWFYPLDFCRSGDLKVLSPIWTGFISPGEVRCFQEPPAFMCLLFHCSPVK